MTVAHRQATGLDHAAPPGAAFFLLSRRATAGAVAWLLGLSAMAWWVTVGHAESMSGMVMGLGQVGARAPGDIIAPVFLAMWVGMMVAMMFPAVAPMVLAHRAVVLTRGEGRLPTVAFVAGYLVAWTVAGLVPLGCLLAFRDLSAGAAESWWLPTVAGAVIAGAGVYQFTGLKETCLRHCRSPVGFVMTHDFGAGSVGAMRAGIVHGAFCLGCCSALMAVLVVVGLMNLVWMVGLSLVFLAEKASPHARALTRIVGVAFIVVGLVVIISPDVLPTLSGAGEPAAPDMQMPGTGG